MSGSVPKNHRPAIRILFLIRTLHTGGAERQLVLLAKALQARGVAVAVAIYESRGGFQPELVQAEIPVYDLGARGRWDLLGLASALRRLVGRLRPGVVHGYMSHSNLLLLLLRAALPPAKVVCGVRSSGLALSNYAPITRWGELLHRRMLRRADLIVCNSQAGRRELIAAAIDPSRCVYVPNGVDTHRFRRDAEARVLVREEWGIHPEDVLIGLVGRIHPMKNHAALLRVVAFLSERWPRLRVACIGEGDEQHLNLLRHLSRDLRVGDRILWLGRQDDMAAVYSALDMLCLPSNWGEGFPNVIGEAMSCGLPCVASDIGDVAEIIGNIGWVVPPDDDTALADALNEAMERLPEWDPLPPRKRIVERFSVERLVDATLAALEMSPSGEPRCAD